MDFYDILLAKKLNGEGGGDSTGIIVTEEILPNGGIVKHIEGQVISGTKQISSNGEFDVSAYKSANVNVSGGSTELHPQLTVTFTPVGSWCNFLKSGILLDSGTAGNIQDGSIVVPEYRHDKLQSDETKTSTFVVPVYEDDGYKYSETSADYFIQIPISANVQAVTTYNNVNCTYDDGDIIITDITKDASISISIAFEQPN